MFLLKPVHQRDMGWQIKNHTLENGTTVNVNSPGALHLSVLRGVLHPQRLTSTPFRIAVTSSPASSSTLTIESRFI